MNLQRLTWIAQHPVTFLFASTTLIVAGGNALWHQNRDRLGPDHRTLAIDEIHVNQPGPWLDSGLASELAARIAAGNPNPKDRELVSAIAEFLRTEPPIEAVEKVTKRPGGLDIVATWRSPVACVRMPEGHFRLVDRQGVILDRQLVSESDAATLLRLAVLYPGGGHQSDWQVWQDSRIVAAAAIAGEISDVWQELGLNLVVTYRPPEPTGVLDGPFELWTANHAIVVWSDEGATDNETLIDRRIEAVRAWIRANGPLDGLLAKRMMLDVRSGSARLIPSTRNAQLPGESDRERY